MRWMWPSARRVQTTSSMTPCEHSRFHLLPIARGTGITTIFLHAAFQLSVDFIVGKVWKFLERRTVQLFGKLQLLGFGQGQQCWETFENHRPNVGTAS